jgi:type IV secretory pathway protease TraF
MVSGGFGSLGWRLAVQRVGAARGPLGFLAAFAIILAILAAVGETFGLLISNTDSAAPAGIYSVVSREVKRGELVTACLPFDIALQSLTGGYLRTGACLGNGEPVGKIAGALPADVVDFERNWIAVNSRRIPRSAVASHDSAGRPLPRMPWGKRKVASREVWLLGLNDRSLCDSGYWFCPACERARPTRTNFHVVRGDG